MYYNNYDTVCRLLHCFFVNYDIVGLLWIITLFTVNYDTAGLLWIITLITVDYDTVGLMWIITLITVGYYTVYCGLSLLVYCRLLHCLLQFITVDLL